MPDQHAQRVREVFEQALDLRPAEREAFLDKTCSDDLNVREEVHGLLEASDSAGAFFHELGQQVASKATEVLDEHWGMDRRIGAYRVTDRIGSGGMGTVFLAQRVDGAFERQVALKIIPVGLDNDAARRRFSSERRILGRLEHPHIAQLLDAGITEDARPYLVMEYVDGERITEYGHRKNLTERQLITLFQQVLDAVEHAHQNLIIHRDLKPGNILVDQGGQVKLLDFGVAKLIHGQEELTQTGQILLTPQYAAPEQAVGASITTRTDVYQLGLVLHELLTRQKYSGQISISGDIGTVLGKALHSEPERRYGSAAQLQDDLRRYLNALPVAARPDSVPYRARKFFSRHPFGISLFVIALIALISFSWFSYNLANRLERERDLANSVTELLVDVFDAADPTTKGGDVSARQVLTAGTKRVLGGLESQPELRSDLLLVLGRTYHNLGLYAEAQPLFEQALTLRAQETAGRTAAAHTLLGENFRALGDYASARENATAALSLVESQFEPQSIEVAEASGRLGRILNILGEREAAETLLRTALDTRLKLLTENDPQVALAMDDLGSLHFAKGEYDRVESLALAALEIRRSPDFSDRPALANNLNNLGLALNLQGKPDQAETYLREAVTMRREILDDQHPQLAQSLSNLGVVLEETGSVREAFALFSEAFEIRQAVLPENHPSTAQTLNNLGMAQRRLGQPGAALAAFQQARDTLAGRFGDDHPAIASIDSNIGAAHLDAGNLKEAQRVYQRSLDVRLAKLPEGHPHLAYSLVGLSRVMLKLGSVAEAVQLAQQALDIRQQALPPDHWLVAESEFALGSCLAAAGELDSARKLLERSSRVLADRRGPNDPLTLEALEKLASLP